MDYLPTALSSNIIQRILSLSRLRRLHPFQALVNSIEQFQLTSMCSSTALTSLRRNEMQKVPNLYLLIKNKSFPSQRDGVKTRPITSHRHHPFKVMASRYTRGLSILLKTAIRALGLTLSVVCLDLLNSQKILGKSYGVITFRTQRTSPTV